jgi:hypothetical protein
VRRPAGPWSPSVQSLLRYLRAQGAGIVPEPHGIDAAGREVLSYLEGRDQGAPMIPEILADDGADRLGRLAGWLREALVRFPCTPARVRARNGPSRQAGPARRPGSTGGIRPSGHHGQAEPWATFRELGFHENAAADDRWTRIHFPDEPAR